MWAAFLLFLVFIGSFVLLIVLSSRLMGRVAGKAINNTHRAAQFILETGKIPPVWMKSLTRNLTGRPISEAIDGRNGERARALLLRRLDRLTVHFEHSNVFEDPEARELLLMGLRNARDEWERGDVRAFRVQAHDPVE